MCTSFYYYDSAWQRVTAIPSVKYQPFLSKLDQVVDTMKLLLSAKREGPRQADSSPKYDAKTFARDS